MRLLEFESKRILNAAGIPVPKGRAVSSADEAARVTAELGRPVAIKAQVLATGRGKAGGVQFARDAEEARSVAHRLLGQKLKGYTIEQVLVEERLDIASELYIAATYDEAARSRVMLVSDAGGVDINEIARQDPSRIGRVLVSSWMGLQPYQAKELAYHLKLPPDASRKVQSILLHLWDVFVGYDATLAEINPLVLTSNGEIVAADAHIEIEDDALFRQRDRLKRLDIVEREDKARPPTPFELEAAEIDRMDYRGVAGRVVEFDGDLGLLIGAGGGSLTIFDALLRNGARPANYCELGGNPPVSKVYRLAKLILSKPGVRGIAVITNVFSNSRVDFLARGLIKALVELGIDPARYPIVFRSAGAFEEDGYAILRKYGVPYLGRETTVDEAARLAAEMMRKLEPAPR